MDRYLEAFERAEQARIATRDEEAVEAYQEAVQLAEDSGGAELHRVYHMWAVCLTNLEQTDAAFQMFGKADRRWPRNISKAALHRDMGRLQLQMGKPFVALRYIRESEAGIRGDDLAERGATIGYEARVHQARGDLLMALELFGAADWLLRRSPNRYYELYNKLRFVAAMIENGEIFGAEELIGEADALAQEFGGDKHLAELDRLQELIATTPDRD